MEWREIVGYEGIYQVNEFGHIKNVLRDKINKQFGGGSGYMMISLSRDGSTSKKYIHRLVAEAFIPNVEDKPLVNHNDGNKTNNKPENLEWVTNQENIIHSFANGLQTMRYKYKPVQMLDKVTSEVLQEFESVTQAGTHFGKTEQNIIACCKGRKKSAYGYAWRYVDVQNV